MLIGAEAVLTRASIQIKLIKALTKDGNQVGTVHVLVFILMSL